MAATRARLSLVQGYPHRTRRAATSKKGLQTHMTILRTRYSLMPVMGLLLALAVFWFSSPAHAAFPCTWAPGEVQVGENNGVPLCEQRGGPAQGPAPVQMVWVDNHYALAAHSYASDVWVAIGYPNGEAAKQAAMSACAADMGQDCVPMSNSYNSSYVVGIGKEGVVYSEWDSTVAKARKRLTDVCTKNNDVCSELSNGTASQGRKVAGSFFRYTPEIWRPKGNFRHIFAAAAWVDQTSSAAPLDVWVASGHRSPDDAIQAAVATCTRETGSKCLAIQTVASTFMYAYIIDDVTLAVGTSPTAKLAKSIMDRRCKKGKKCKLTGVFDARQGGVVRHQAGKL